ncbi:MAG: COX15/CtaA family protein [Chloroflexota bacterium]|nr:COX15/CtaA family protein [Chloroflexota bacterium]
MSRTEEYGRGGRLIFRVLAVASLVAAFAQVTLGGIVRVTGSGLGCPDWPLCHGQIIPPFEFATLLEYSHRLSASLLGVLVLATMIVVLMRYRSNRWGKRSVLTALILVFVAAVLGGATVLTHLAWWLRLLHLGIAEGAVAALVVAVIVSWRVGAANAESVDAATSNAASADVPDTDDARSVNRLLIAALVGVFLLILSGSYIVGAGYGSSCGTWPLCRGSLFPEGRAYIEHMGHRYFAAIVGLLILAVAYKAWQMRFRMPSVGWSGVLLAASFAAQILVGALTVWLGFTPEIKAIHLSMATLVWIALVFVAGLVYVPQRFTGSEQARGDDEIVVADGLSDGLIERA